VKEEKPVEEVNIQPDDKKLKSDEKKQKSEEKKQKVEIIKSQFVLFGQVINHNYLSDTVSSEPSSQVVEEPIKVEADPSLFAIDDESPAKQVEQVKPKVENKVETKESKNTPTKPIKTYEIVPFQATEFYKCEKDNKKSGFANVKYIQLE
jgi:hypothetical protein